MTQPDLYGTAARPDRRGCGRAADAGTADAGTAPAPAEPGPAGGRAAEPGAAGKHAGAPAQEGLRPGEATDRLGDFGDIAFGNLLPDAAQYTTQWQQIQFRFVDDPQGSVTEAADVLSQVTAKLEAAIQERQRAIEERQRAIQERAARCAAGRARAPTPRRCAKRCACTARSWTSSSDRGRNAGQTSLTDTSRAE